MIGDIITFDCPNEPYQIMRSPVEDGYRIMEYTPSDKEQYVVKDIYGDYVVVESVKYPSKIIAWTLMHYNGKFWYKKSMYQKSWTPIPVLEQKVLDMTDTQMDYIAFEGFEEGETEVTSAYREYYPIHDTDF